MLIFNDTMSSSKRNIQDDAIRQAHLDISRLKNILYNLLPEKKYAEAKLNLSVMAMDTSIKNLFLVDEDNIIIFANRYLYEGKPAEDVSTFQPNNASLVGKTNQPKIFFLHDKESTLKSYHPVILSIENSQGLPIKRVGSLYSEISLDRKLYLARQQALKQSIVYGGIMVSVIMIVALILHYMVSRRLYKFFFAAKKLAQVNLESRSDI
ncbi:MAG: hypothetical protein HUJ30_00185, partial [Gammaproteobacteria bacterium]|nr:hypothetical protein [Gammaproteobacteria bacterium]